MGDIHGGQEATGMPHHAAVLGEVALRHDMTEMPGLDNLAQPEGAIAEAQALAAAGFGAERTWLGVNGSTGAIHAAVLATCAPGEVLVMARSSHQSVYTAAAMAGADGWYVQPPVDEEFGVAHPVTAEAVGAAIDAALRAGRRVGAAAVVSPTYYGAVADVSAIADACHARGVPLVVDEAHGAHLSRCAELGLGGGGGALAGGADLVVQSAHKTLSALTPGAFLHMGAGAVACGVEADRVGRAMRASQTSSPSYLVMAALDAARAQLFSASGEAALREAAAATDAARERLAGSLTPTMCARAPPEGVAAWDPLRLTVCTRPAGVSGFAALDWLAAPSDWLDAPLIGEAASSHAAVFALGMGSRRADGEALADGMAALRRWAAAEGDNRSVEDPAAAAAAPTQLPVPAAAVSLREAFFARAERVPLAAAEGRASAELLSPYPPGSPLVAPGEVLTRDVLDALLACARSPGGAVVGAEDASLETLAVIAQ